MLDGDFSTDNADNLKLCPNGFFNTPKSGYPQGGWCNDLGDTIYPDGSKAIPLPVSRPSAPRAVTLARAFRLSSSIPARRP